MVIYMKNNTLIRATLITLVLLALFTVVMLVLGGKNGLINKEIQRYNETHTEQKDNGNDQNQNDNIVVVNK